MEQETEALSNLQPRSWRDRWQPVRAKVIKLIPFIAGILATLLALLLYNALNPAPEPLTIKQVNLAVAEAMASATPPPAYSAQVYRVIQPSLVLDPRIRPGRRRPGEGRAGQRRGDQRAG